jgi:hypothetical protein
MTSGSWSEWQVVQLQECFVRGIGPQETAALLGKTQLEVCDKARELGLLVVTPDADSPATAPTLSELFPRDIVAS